jgi:hypothetical protein
MTVNLETENHLDAAAELQRQELARLLDHVPPSLFALRSMMPQALRNEVALMLERFDYASSMIRPRQTFPSQRTAKSLPVYVLSSASPIRYIM